ncbi:hypothetical protein VNO78_23383 [Psophocarpus tetragonolobus]|uniref:Uncharacterized protein n=1 Tax=Psophocarpus tetragonolobus TaxID=3891 RepID=A0AAN9S6L9_PSOTE
MIRQRFQDKSKPKGVIIQCSRAVKAPRLHHPLPSIPNSFNATTASGHLPSDICLSFKAHDPPIYMAIRHSSKSCAVAVQLCCMATCHSSNGHHIMLPLPLPPPYVIPPFSLQSYVSFVLLQLELNILRSVSLLTFLKWACGFPAVQCFLQQFF